MGITARRQVQQNWFEGRADPLIIVRPVVTVREEKNA